MYIHENSLDRRNRLYRRRSGSKNKIIVLMVTIFFLSVIGTIAVYSPFDYIQVVAAYRTTLIVLISIVAVGLVAIPFGNLEEY